MGRCGVVCFGMLQVVTVVGGVGSACAGCGLGVLCCVVGHVPELLAVFRLVAFVLATHPEQYKVSCNSKHYSGFCDPRSQFVL